MKYDLVPYGEFQAKLMTTIVARTAPDIITVDMPNVAAYARQGLLASLSDFSGFKESAFFDPLVNAAKYKGNIYAVPREFGVLLLFYNADLFQKAGLKVPTNEWTWKDLWDVSRTFAKSMGKPAFSTPSLDYVFAPFVLQSGGRIMKEDLADTQLDSKQVIEAGEFYAQGRAEGWAINPQDYGKSQAELFAAGDVAMVLDTLNVAASVEFKYGAVYPPAGTAGEGTLLYGSAFAVPAQTRSRQAAMNAIACLTSEANQREIQKSAQTYVLPARRALLSDKSVPRDVLAQTAFSAATLPSVTYAWGVRHYEVSAAINQALQRVYGGMSVTDSFRLAAKDIRALLVVQ